jgi:hypothetical protein
MIAALIDWPWALLRYVDPEGLQWLKADRPDEVPCAALPPCFSSKRAQPLRHDGICVSCSGITLHNRTGPRCSHTGKLHLHRIYSFVLTPQLSTCNLLSTIRFGLKSNGGRNPSSLPRQPRAPWVLWEPGKSPCNRVLISPTEPSLPPGRLSLLADLVHIAGAMESKFCFLRLVVSHPVRLIRAGQEARLHGHLLFPSVYRRH